MTTLYRPVPITNLDQANALPRGSVVFDGDPEDGQTYYRSGDDWYVDGHPGLMSIAVECRTPVTALVPIEAEEEFTAMGTDDGEHWIAHVGRDGIDGTRKEAELYVDRFGGFIASRALTPWTPTEEA